MTIGTRYNQHSRLKWRCHSSSLFSQLKNRLCLPVDPQLLAWNDTWRKEISAHFHIFGLKWHSYIPWNRQMNANRDEDKMCL